MTTPNLLTSLVEAIQQIQSPIVKEADVVPEKPASEFQGLMDALQSSFLKYFPNGYFRIQHSKRFGNSIIISLGLIKDQKDVSSNIRENDPMHTNIFLHYNEATGVFEVGSSSSGLSINPEEGSHMAMGTVKNPVRKFKTDNQDVIIKKLDQYFAKCKEIVKANWDNIYGVDRIDPKYMVENTDVTDYDGKKQSGVSRKDLLDKFAKTKSSKDAEAARRAGATQMELKAARESNIQESSANEIQISGQDLLQASAAVSKYPNDIRLKVIGKNKFSLTLSNKSLLDSDKAIANIFKSLKESINIIEDGEEVFKNDNGKVIASIKDGKQMFTAYNNDGAIVGKPFISKTIAVTALNKAVSKPTKAVQESEIEVPAKGSSEFFGMLNTIPGDFSEENPLKLGNVNFWKDKEGAFKGQWAYDVRTNEWDQENLTKDLFTILQKNKG